MSCPAKVDRAHTPCARAQPRFKNWGCMSIFPSCPYKRPTAAVKGVYVRGMGGCPLPQLTMGSGLGRMGSSPCPSGVWSTASAATILGCFMCNFMRFHAPFSAFNSCMRDSYIPLLASRSDIPLLTFWGHPNLNSWDVRTPTVTAAILFCCCRLGLLSFFSGSRTLRTQNISAPRYFGTNFKPNHRWSCVLSELSWVQSVPTFRRSDAEVSCGRSVR